VFCIRNYTAEVRESSPKVWGYTPKVWGYTPKVWGYTPKVWGYTPKVWGYTPKVWGSSPKVWGSSPKVWGSSPEVWGSSPEVWGSSPEVWGSSPKVRGSSPRLRGNGNNISRNDPIYPHVYTEIASDGDFIISFPVGHDLDTSKWNGEKYETIYGESNDAKTVTSVNCEFGTSTDNRSVDIYFKNDLCLAILFDTWRRVYYRFCSMRKPDATVKTSIVTLEVLNIEYVDFSKDSEEEFLRFKIFILTLL
jgi:hypothetical protein